MSEATSKFDRAVQMHRDGKSYSEISDVLELRRETVRAYIARARKRGDLPAGELKQTPEVRLVLSAPVLDALRPEANARATTPKALARRILECVCSDDLVGAVLDDCEAEHG
ncbi:hypothetical protein K3X44_09905 [Aliiroseovarius crassostreae]|uniref:sigma factor-like helix-turn-helix DNA-binding protein n=1 Tax=Aliiroseovarius crassostreae TaxID=154981 RepID=UPI002201E8E4|nr:sigma factor-like helix-turn-helix DNA-binding protein [Aliiroseovarius crassostreae]UWQ00829.1 hypothetical protein K3X44_09905 [Aliiroseovarius crassostreae]